MNKVDFIPQGITYLNTAGDGLMSRENYDKLDLIREEFKSNFAEARMKFLLEDESKIRERAAQFMRCNANEICLTKSFSIGFNYLLPSLHQYKKVLLLENDYPSLWLPLGLRDLDIHYVPQLEDLTFSADRIISKAKECQPEIIALSHVQYSTGYLADIKTIGDYCAANGILFIVDGTQALGCVQVDLSEMKIDVYAASTYKWMCAGHGCGLMYINEKLQRKLHYKTGGFMAWYESGEEWKTKQSLTNLEAGHKDHEAFYRLGLALEDVVAKNLGEVLEQNRTLISQFNLFFKSNGTEVISDYSKQEMAGITVIKGNEELFNRLKQNKIYTTYRNGTIRLSCHFYNDAEDLDSLRRAFSEK